MANWMQQLKETYSHMVYSRLLREGGSLNVGKPGQMGEPMQPAMRPMRPGDDPHQRLAAGREQLAKDWQEQEDEDINLTLQQVGATMTPLGAAFGGIVGGPIVAVPAAAEGSIPALVGKGFGYSYLRKSNPFVHQYVDLNGQPKTGQATPAKPTPKSNEQYGVPYQNPNPYGDWDPNKPSNR